MTACSSADIQKLNSGGWTPRTARLNQNRIADFEPCNPLSGNGWGIVFLYNRNRWLGCFYWCNRKQPCLSQIPQDNGKFDSLFTVLVTESPASEAFWIAGFSLSHGVNQYLRVILNLAISHLFKAKTGKLRKTLPVLQTETPASEAFWIAVFSLWHEAQSTSR